VLALTVFDHEGAAVNVNLEPEAFGQDDPCT
jgi:hypothetical protein